MRTPAVVTAMLLLLASCDASDPDPCPSGPSAGQVDFLPLAAGDTWHFEFSESRSAWGSGYHRRGTLSLSLTDVSCEGGQRTVRAEERREGVSWGSSLWTGPSDTTAFEERRAVALVETSEGVRLPWSDGAVSRYHAASAEAVEVGAGYGSGGWCTRAQVAEVVLVPGALASFRTWCHGASGYSMWLWRMATGT